MPSMTTVAILIASRQLTGDQTKLEIEYAAEVYEGSSSDLLPAVV